MCEQLRSDADLHTHNTTYTYSYTCIYTIQTLSHIATRILGCFSTRSFACSLHTAHRARHTAHSAQRTAHSTHAIGKCRGQKYRTIRARPQPEPDQIQHETVGIYIYIYIYI